MRGAPLSMDGRSLPEPEVAAGPSRPGWPVAAVACAALLVHLLCGNRYGVFRDELYYLACGRHLAWGYVDQPPVIALLARFASELFGSSPMGLRIPAYLAHAGAVLVAALLAARLGGGRYAQFLAAFLVLTVPAILGSAHLLTMNAFEPLLWTGLTVAVLQAVEGDRRRGWLAVGAWVGIGFLTKYSMAFWSVGLLVGLLATSARRALKSPWFLVGVGIGAAIALPNFLWQARQGLPMLELLRQQGDKNTPFTWLGYVTEVLKANNPFSILLWGPGLAFLLLDRPSGRRWLGLGFLATAILLGVLHAKPYYLSPAFPSLFAASACTVEELVRRRSLRIAIVMGLLVTAAPLAPLALPLLSPEAFESLRARSGIRVRPNERLDVAAPLPQYFADQFGWPELVESVARLYRALPEEERAQTAILAPDYGMAAAIDFYGPPLGLPPAVSGHNNYWLWGPPPADTRAVLFLGPRAQDSRAAHAACGTFGQVGETPDSRWNMPYERLRPIYLCVDPGDLFEAWRRFRFVR